MSATTWSASVNADRQKKPARPPSPKMVSGNLKKSDVNSPSNVLYALCKNILSRDNKDISEDLVASKHIYALRLLGSRFETSPAITDEFQLSEKIKRGLAK